jgi:putative spermidine/putrescine transport system permease protein
VVGLGFIAPIGFVVYQAFRKTVTYQPTGADGPPLRDPVTQQFVKVTRSSFTAQNLKDSFHGVYHTALMNSVVLSLLTAVIATLVGLVLAHVVVSSGNRVVREIVSTISAVAANFGGIPLAFLFIAALDANSGVVSTFLQDRLHISLQDDLHFDLQGISGMCLVYLYFLVPLMMLVMMPALEGLRPSWAEAAENLGASRWQYWRHVAGPVLLPTVLGALLLLFCSSFSAFATAYALNHTFPLLPTEINNVLNGNSYTGGISLGSALAVDIIIFVLPLTVLYQLLQRRTSRWLA